MIKVEDDKKIYYFTKENFLSANYSFHTEFIQKADFVYKKSTGEFIKSRKTFFDLVEYYAMKCG